MTSALPARQPFARVTGSFEEVRESRKSGSVIGVVGHGQIGRTTQAGWQFASSFHFGDEVGVAAERCQVELHELRLSEGRLRDWSQHAGGDLRCGCGPLTDHDDDIEARLAESPAN